RSHSSIAMRNPHPSSPRQQRRGSCSVESVDKFPALNSVPRLSANSSALLTYEPYYGLREKPFSLSTDPKFLYKSSAHAGTFEDLLLAIRRREGLIVLAGDIG